MSFTYTCNNAHIFPCKVQSLVNVVVEIVYTDLSLSSHLSFMITFSFEIKL